MKALLLISVALSTSFAVPAVAQIETAQGSNNHDLLSLNEPDRLHPDVVYQVIFMKDKEYLASPTVVGKFGREVRIEVPNLMRVAVMADKPDQEGRSFTSARMSLYQDGVWHRPKEMSMTAMLSLTPSFEYSVEGTPYRFVVMPRLIVPAAE